MRSLKLPPSPPPPLALKLSGLQLALCGPEMNCRLCVASGNEDNQDAALQENELQQRSSNAAGSVDWETLNITYYEAAKESAPSMLHASFTIVT